MAAIDKLYGNKEQFDIFRHWIALNKPEYLAYFRPWPERDPPDKVNIICVMPTEADEWLAEHCPIQFVRHRILEQYGH